MIQENRDSTSPLSISVLTSAHGVSRSGYYKWRKRNGIVQEDDEPVILKEIEKIVEEIPGYGYRRVTMELRHRDFTVNHKRVYRIMKENDLCFHRKVFHPQTTDSRHLHPVYQNLILGMDIDGPNKVWASDITYIQLNREFVYLSVILDLGTRRVIGWSLGRGLDNGLIIDALHMALYIRRGIDLNGVIHHSDQGRQYASIEYTQCLKNHGIEISMSRRGNPYDNAFVESFFKTLKCEEVYLNEYETYEDALLNIGHFIEEVYNKKRMHSALGYKSRFIREFCG